MSLVILFLFSILLQACSLYIAEIAPKGRRGAMVSMVVTFTLIASVVSVHCMSLLPKLWQSSMIETYRLCVSIDECCRQCYY